jgi:hypothetical protein
MAALRSVLDRLDLLLLGLNRLPGYLRLRLSRRLASSCASVERDVDRFQAYCDDEEAVQQVGEAAADDGSMMDAASTTTDAALMDKIRDAAERTSQLLSVLDTTTAGAVVLDTELAPLEIPENDESDLIGLAIMYARIERLRCRVRETLAGLERREGAERSESLRWLVWQLCELYHRETGQPVTNSAGPRSSIPKSAAGRFVLAAVKALQPSEAWTREPDHLVAKRREHVLHKGVLERGTYFALRAYVAAHSPSTTRRGRWKRVQ